MTEQFKIRDMRKKEKYFVDDAYLNGYARLCGVYATAVYNSLSRHANFHNQTCFPSIEKIAEQHSISKRSVIRGIEELRKWRIIKRIKEKDKKTKRQRHNTYFLLDKSEWIPKPQGESRVSDTHSESRVHISPEPSALQSKSRVSEMDCKDNKDIKDYKFKDNSEFIKDKKKLQEWFDTFWDAYPRKTAKTKATEAWNKVDLTQEVMDAIMLALEKQKKSPQWTKDAGQFIPHPTTWLNQERWNDQINIPSGKVAPGKYDNLKSIKL